MPPGSGSNGADRQSATDPALVYHVCCNFTQQIAGSSLSIQSLWHSINISSPGHEYSLAYLGARRQLLADAGRPVRLLHYAYSPPPPKHALASSSKRTCPARSQPWIFSSAMRSQLTSQLHACADALRKFRLLCKCPWFCHLISLIAALINLPRSLFSGNLVGQPE
jgi:hypothetical protein